MIDPEGKSRADKSATNETQALYDHLVGEVNRLAQHDQEAARRRPPLAKALLAACLIAGVVAAVTLIYGFIAFPEAPIRQTASGYVSKRGRPQTREDYEQYQLWGKVVLISFGVAFIFGFGAGAAEKMNARNIK